MLQGLNVAIATLDYLVLALVSAGWICSNSSDLAWAAMILP